MLAQAVKHRLFSSPPCPPLSCSLVDWVLFFFFVVLGGCMWTHSTKRKMRLNLSQCTKSTRDAIKEHQSHPNQNWTHPCQQKSRSHFSTKKTPKYKKIDKKIKPVPGQITSSMKVQRRFPELTMITKIYFQKRKS